METYFQVCPGGCFQKDLSREGKTCRNVAGSIHGTWIEEKGDNEIDNSILFPNYDCIVTSLLELQMLCLPFPAMMNYI